MPILTLQVQSSAADGEEISTGAVLRQGYNITPGRTDDNVFWQYSFFRFIGVSIPQGATINSAILTFQSYSYYYTQEGTPPAIAIYAEKAVNPTALTTTPDYTVSSEISGRARTVSTVNWAAPAFVGASKTVNGPDIKTIIQEIVNQGSWQNGNPINIIFVNSDPGTASNYIIFDAYNWNPSRAAILTINYTEATPSGGTGSIVVPKQKDFLYKIYDKDGVYLDTWADEVVSVPKFLWKMNGGMGEINIQLKRSLKDFGEGVDVAFGNIVKCYIQDGDQENGKKIWEGKINRYEPSSTSDGTEIIEVIATSRILEMENRLIKNGNDTEYAFASKDPSDILKAIIDMPSAGGILLKGLINSTGTTASYTFQANTIREGFDICVKLAPQYWYFWLDADNQINFKIANFEEIDHRLYVGKEVSNVRMTKSIENLCNRVFFMGGGNPNLYKMYERTSSQSEWGLREKYIKDERVTVDATASLLATSYLDNHDHPISEIEIEVVDSNIDPINGYDIERFKPGDIIRCLHPEMEKRNTLWDEAYWDVDYWDFDVRYALGQPHQILEINYEFNKCILKLSAKLEDFQKRIEEVKRNLDETAKQNLPSAPS